MQKLISTITYLDGEFVKRTTRYNFGIDEDAILKQEIELIAHLVTKLVTIAGQHGECIVGDATRQPSAIDGSLGYMLCAEINGRRYSFFVQVAGTAQDTI